MNPEQRSVTLAFLLVFGSITVRNHWYERFKVWIQKSPGDATKNAPVSTNTQYGVRNWQAALTMYIILMIMAETPMSPIVPPVGWGIALIEAFAALGTGTGTLSAQFPGVFGGSTQTPFTQAPVSGQSTTTLPEGSLVGA